MFANLKNHIYISIQTLYLVLCWSTLGSDYSLFLGRKLQAWHTCIWEVSPIPLCRSSQALSGWMGSVAAEMFRSLQRCSIGFKSSFWLGRSRTFWDLSRRHSCVVFAMCLGTSSCWKMNLHPSLRSWAFWSRFSWRKSILTSFPVPTAEKHPQAWCCHHHASP